MNPAGAEKVDPMDLAFDSAPEREATEAEVAALREARAEAAAGTALTSAWNDLGSRMDGRRAT
jgi:hypothetical protein